MKLILIGFSGSGKSALTQELARELALTPVELDDLISDLAGKRDPSEIIATGGEGWFRSLERKVARAVGVLDNVVVSAGGGIVTNPENILNLKRGGGLVLYLKTSSESVVERLGNDWSGRPLLTNMTSARNLFEQRMPLYRSYADRSVTTDAKSTETLCAEILSEFRFVPQIAVNA